MTDTKVVDASALAALLFNENEAASIAAQLQGARLVAPSLLDFELANVCLTKLRRQPEQAANLLSAFALRHRLNIARLPVDHDSVLALATATKLTAYDAGYLWLARDLDADLVTLDRQLARVMAAGSEVQGRPNDS